MLRHTLILLGRIPVLNVFVCNNAHCILGNSGDIVGHSFLKSAHSFDVYTIMFLIDLHVMWPQEQLYGF